jgi:ribosome-binding factor A
MTVDRSRRVAEQIQRYLSSEAIPALRDPRLGFATITSVDLTRDLKNARVYVTFFEQDEGKRKAALKALEGAAGLFRREMARELRLRYTPVLTFHEDESIDRADRIERLIRDIHAQDPERKAGDEDSDEGPVSIPGDEPDFDSEDRADYDSEE